MIENYLKKLSKIYIMISVLYDMHDNNNRLLLREFRIIPIEGADNLKQEMLEYIIWANAETINRISK